MLPHWRVFSRRLRTDEEHLGDGPRSPTHRLSLGTSEAPLSTAFKVRRIATLAADGKTANLALTPDEQELKCVVAPEIFAPVPNAWGKQGWTTVTLGKATAADLARRLRWRGTRLTPPDVIVSTK
jgi:hypothetical protein